MSLLPARTSRWIGCLALFLLLFVSSVPTSRAQTTSPYLDARVFDWRFYLNNNADLLRAGIKTRTQAQNHWLQNGIKEGRQGSPSFYSREYLDLYPDVRSAYGATNYTGALNHYLTYGFNEKRRGYIGDGRYGRYTVQNDRILVSTSTRQAGAVDSIYWNNREFVNSFDHGRQVQFALFKGKSATSAPTPSEVGCFNPTEAGSLNDGLKDSSTSVLEAISASGNTLQTQVLPAFWLAPGQKDPTCTAGAPTTTTTSQYRMNTSVQVGYAGIPNAIQFKVQVYIPENAPNLLIEVPATYASGDFTSFYTYDPKAAKLSSLTRTGTEGEVGLPVILATSNGAYAIGSWSPELPQANYPANAYGYGYFASQGPDNAEATTKLRGTYRALNVPAGTALKYRSYIAVGTLSDVQTTIQQLYSKWKAGNLPY